MGLRVLIGISRHWASHLKGVEKICFPRLDLKDPTWRPFLTQQFSGQRESEHAVTTNAVTSKTHNRWVTTRTRITDVCFREFLLEKGATAETIDSIISRYPQALIHSSENLKLRWNLWKSVLQTDQLTIDTIKRSPASFLRTSDLENLQNNITFLHSLGISPNAISRLISKSPGILSKHVSLNRDLVNFLQNTCLSLGGKNPEEFVRKIILRNVYVLSCSTRRIRANMEILHSTLKLPDIEMLRWVHGVGFVILDSGNSHIKIRIDQVKEKLESLGCSEEDTIRCIKVFPKILVLSTENVNNKIDLLLKNGIKMHQIVMNTIVLKVSIETIRSRCEYLLQHGYDFQASGITVLNLSSARFQTRVKRKLDLKEEQEQI